ncbi:hypothetical protein ACOMHN_006832 [Nucella lapillus]
MPTSSQARILSREDPKDFNSLLTTRFHHQRASDTSTLPACLLQPSAGISLPHINLFKAPGSPIGTLPEDGADAASADSSQMLSLAGICSERLPSLESRVPHLVCYPSQFQNGWFRNISNNRPGDVDEEEQLPEGVVVTSTESTTKHESRKSVQETGKGRRKSSQVTRRTSRFSRERSIEGKHAAGPSRPQRKFSLARKRPPKPGARTTADPEDSDEDVPEESINFEVNLLAEEKDGSIMETSMTDAPEEDAAPVPGASPQASLATPPAPRKPHMTIKSLFKQLLTIGLSSNAFRGVVVHTKEGESKNATEEEAEEALQNMASGMVGPGSEGQEESEEEEDDEVELVMGSLLTDVGTNSRIDLAQKHPPPTDTSLPKKTREPPKPGVPEVAVDAPAASENLIDPVKTSTDVPEYGVPSAVNDDSLETTAEAIPVPVRTKTEPTEDEKAFLQSVTAGVAYKTASGVVKPPVGKKPVEKLTKKKVYKLPPVRLRRSLPPSDPHLLCIRSPNVDLTHEQVKNMLEAQMGNIVSLQHDPEYLQTGDVHLVPRVMWIFKMEDMTETNYIKMCMDVIVGYDGETLRIRKRDDVYNEEHRAFLLVKQIKEAQAKHIKHRKDRKDASRAAQMSTGQQAGKPKAAA